MRLNYDPRDMSQVFVNLYYETSKKREFIMEVKKRFPELDEIVIEAIYYTIDFMNLVATK